MTIAFRRWAKLAVSVAVLALCIGVLFALWDPYRSSRVRWLREHAVVVRSADPDDVDFSDLEPLKRAIGDARVVLLGEETHGDGTTFSMKARLVKFLHEALGFDVLALEASLYSCAGMDAALRGDLPLEGALRVGIPSSFWIDSRQMRPVFRYVRSTYATGRSLEVAGFDSFLPKDESGSFARRLVAFLGSRAVADSTPDLERLLETIADRRQYFKLSPSERSRVRQLVAQLPILIETNQRDLETRHGARAVAFWMQVTRLLPFQLTRLDEIQEIEAGRKTPPSNDWRRDKVMGDTLVWLAKAYYPDRKIVVWAANTHIMRRPNEIESGTRFPAGVSMGDVLFQTLGEKTYAIGFTAFQGRAGLAMRGAALPHDIGTAPRRSFETYLHRTGHDLLFVDLRGARDASSDWLREPRQARPIAYASLRSNWTRHFDALFFTDTMVPSELLPDKTSAH